MTVEVEHDTWRKRFGFWQSRATCEQEVCDTHRINIKISVGHPIHEYHGKYRLRKYRLWYQLTSIVVDSFPKACRGHEIRSTVLYALASEINSAGLHSGSAKGMEMV